MSSDGVIGMLIVATTFLIGGITPAVTFLLVFNIIDFITGVMSGYINNELESSIMTKGLFKKTGMWTMVIVAHGLDVVAFKGVDLTRSVIIVALMANEGLSIAENVGRLGVRVPSKLVDSLKQLQDTPEDKKK